MSSESSSNESKSSSNESKSSSNESKSLYDELKCLAILLGGVGVASIIGSLPAHAAGRAEGEGSGIPKATTVIGTVRPQSSVQQSQPVGHLEHLMAIHQHLLTAQYQIVGEQMQLKEQEHQLLEHDRLLVQWRYEHQGLILQNRKELFQINDQLQKNQLQLIENERLQLIEIEKMRGQQPNTRNPENRETP